MSPSIFCCLHVDWTLRSPKPSWNFWRRANEERKLMSKRRKHTDCRWMVALASLAAGMLTGGCNKKAASGPPGGGMPPTRVVAVDAKREAVTESLSLVGTIAANEMVEIKAETEGIVQEITFNEGERVEKGHVLVKLDESKLASAL